MLYVAFEYFNFFYSKENLYSPIFTNFFQTKHLRSKKKKQTHTCYCKSAWPSLCSCEGHSLLASVVRDNTGNPNMWWCFWKSSLWKVSTICIYYPI